MANICQFVCPYRTPISGYCGLTGGYATCPHRKMYEPPTIKSAELMTNADKIRKMSDEELADFIGSIFTIERDMWGDYDPKTVVTQEPRVEVRNKEDMLDWLKQEV